MSATDIAPSRLEWAKAEAHKQIDAAADGDFGMVIEFNSNAEIKQSYTGDKGLLHATALGTAAKGVVQRSKVPVLLVPPPEAS